MPSDPTNRPLRLYPADDFRGLRRVLMIVPSASTTVRLITQSFIVPYLTAFVPEQFVPIMPPIFADGPVLFSRSANIPHPMGIANRAPTRSTRQNHDIFPPFPFPFPRPFHSPGSTGKNSPLPMPASCSFRSCHPMLGWTTMSMSSRLNCTMRSMNAKSTLTPPNGAEKLPSSELPPEYGMMGTRYLWQMRAMALTCSVDRGYATATGSPSGLVDDHSE